MATPAPMQMSTGSSQREVDALRIAFVLPELPALFESAKALGVPDEARAMIATLKGERYKTARALLTNTSWGRQWESQATLPDVIKLGGRTGFVLSKGSVYGDRVRLDDRRVVNEVVDSGPGLIDAPALLQRMSIDATSPLAFVETLSRIERTSKLFVQSIREVYSTMARQAVVGWIAANGGKVPGDLTERWKRWVEVEFFQSKDTVVFETETAMHRAAVLYACADRAFGMGLLSTRIVHSKSSAVDKQGFFAAYRYLDDDDGSTDADLVAKIKEEYMEIMQRHNVIVRTLRHLATMANEKSNIVLKALATLGRQIKVPMGTGTSGTRDDEQVADVRFGVFPDYRAAGLLQSGTRALSTAFNTAKTKLLANDSIAAVGTRLLLGKKVPEHRMADWLVWLTRELFEISDRTFLFCLDIGNGVQALPVWHLLGTGAEQAQQHDDALDAAILHIVRQMRPFTRLDATGQAEKLQCDEVVGSAARQVVGDVNGNTDLVDQLKTMACETRPSGCIGSKYIEAKAAHATKADRSEALARALLKFAELECDEDDPDGEEGEGALARKLCERRVTRACKEDGASGGTKVACGKDHLTREEQEDVETFAARLCRSDGSNRNRRRTVSGCAVDDEMNEARQQSMDAQCIGKLAVADRRERDTCARLATVDDNEPGAQCARAQAWCLLQGLQGKGPAAAACKAELLDEESTRTAVDEVLHEAAQQGMSMCSTLRRLRAHSDVGTRLQGVVQSVLDTSHCNETGMRQLPTTPPTQNQFWTQLSEFIEYMQQNQMPSDGPLQSSHVMTIETYRQMKEAFGRITTDGGGERFRTAIAAVETQCIGFEQNDNDDLLKVSDLQRPEYAQRMLLTPEMVSNAPDQSMYYLMVGREYAAWVVLLLRWCTSRIARGQLVNTDLKALKDVINGENGPPDCNQRVRVEIPTQTGMNTAHQSAVIMKSSHAALRRGHVWMRQSDSWLNKTPLPVSTAAAKISAYQQQIFEHVATAVVPFVDDLVGTYSDNGQTFTKNLLMMCDACAAIPIRSLLRGSEVNKSIGTVLTDVADIIIRLVARGASLHVSLAPLKEWWARFLVTSLFAPDVPELKARSVELPAFATTSSGDSQHRRDIIGLLCSAMTCAIRYSESVEFHYAASVPLRTAIRDHLGIPDVRKRIFADGDSTAGTDDASDRLRTYRLYIAMYGLVQSIRERQNVQTIVIEGGDATPNFIKEIALQSTDSTDDASNIGIIADDGLKRMKLAWVVNDNDVLKHARQNDVVLKNALKKDKNASRNLPSVFVKARVYTPTVTGVLTGVAGTALFGLPYLAFVGGRLLWNPSTRNEMLEDIAGKITQQQLRKKSIADSWNVLREYLTNKDADTVQQNAYSFLFVSYAWYQIQQMAMSLTMDISIMLNIDISLQYTLATFQERKQGLVIHNLPLFLDAMIHTVAKPGRTLVEIIRDDFDSERDTMDATTLLPCSMYDKYIENLANATRTNTNSIDINETDARNALKIVEAYARCLALVLPLYLDLVHGDHTDADQRRMQFIYLVSYGLSDPKSGGSDGIGVDIDGDTIFEQLSYTHAPGMSDNTSGVARRRQTTHLDRGF